MKVHGFTLDSFEQDFLEAMFFFDIAHPDGEHFEKDLTIFDMDKKSLEKLLGDCQRFQEQAGDMLPDGMGNTFYLARVGAGVSFEHDHGLPAKLDALAESFGHFDLEVGDDCKVYLFPMPE